MKKLFIFAMVVFAAGSSLADVGWFNDYLSVSVNGEANTQYSVDAWHGTDLGGVSTLSLKAIDCSYWSDNQDRTGGSFWYQIYEKGNATPVVGATEVIWAQAGPSGNDYNGTWSGSQDMLGSYDYVEDTDYYVQVWAKSWGSLQGDSYLNNNNSPTNYEATFQAVPEPAVMGLVLVFGTSILFGRRLFMR